MTQKSLTDENLIALSKRFQRDQTRVLLALMMLVAIPVAWVFSRPSGPEPVAVLFLVGAAIMSSVGAGLWIQRLRPPVEALSSRIFAQQSDALQGRRVWMLLAYPALAVLWTPGLVHWTTNIVGRRAGWVEPFGLLAVVLMTAYYVVFLLGAGVGKQAHAAYSDELSEAHRAKAVQIAYWAALTGGLLLFLLGLYQPMWAVVGLPLVLVHSISFGMLRFAILDRRRDRGR